MKTAIQQEKDSLHLDKQAHLRKIQVLSEQNLELEKEKMELEMRIKNLELLLKEESGRSTSNQEKYNNIKQQLQQQELFDRNFPREDTDNENDNNCVAKLKDLTGMTKKTERQVIIINQLKDELKELQALGSVKESRWLTERSVSEKEVAVLKEQLKCDEDLVEESSMQMCQRLGEVVRENERLQGMMDRLNIEMGYLKNDLEHKTTTISSLQEQHDKIMKQHTEMVAYTVVEALQSNLQELKKKIEDKEMLCVCKEESILKLEKKLSSSLSDMDGLKRLKCSLSEQLEMKKQEVDKLEQEYRLFKKISNDNERDLRDSMEQQKLDSAHNIQEIPPNNNLQQQLSLSQQHNQQLNADLHNLNLKLKVKEDLLAEKWQALKALKDQSAVLDAQVNSLKLKLALLEGEKERNGSSQKEFTKVKGQLRSSQAEVNNLNRKIKSLSQQELSEENIILILKSSNAKLRELSGFVQLKEKLTLTRKELNDTILSLPKVEANKRKSMKMSKEAIKINMETHYSKLLNKKLKELNQTLYNTINNSHLATEGVSDRGKKQIT